MFHVKCQVPQLKLLKSLFKLFATLGEKKGVLLKQRCDCIKKLKQKLLSPCHPKKSRCCKLLTVSRRRPLSYRNQSIDLLCKSMYWFLYDNVLHLERVKRVHCQDFYPSRVDEIIISDIFVR